MGSTGKAAGSEGMAAEREAVRPPRRWSGCGSAEPTRTRLPRSAQPWKRLSGSERPDGVRDGDRERRRTPKGPCADEWGIGAACDRPTIGTRARAQALADSWDARAQALADGWDAHAQAFADGWDARLQALADGWDARARALANGCDARGQEPPEACVRSSFADSVVAAWAVRDCGW